MQPTDLTQFALLTITLSLAFARGSKWEIVGSVLILTAAVLTPMAESKKIVAVDPGLLAIDVLLGISLLALAIASKRRWARAAALSQMASIVTHLLRSSVTVIDPGYYGAMVAFWAYPVMLSLMAGTLFEASRDLHWPWKGIEKDPDGVHRTTGTSLAEVGNDLSMGDDVQVLGRMFELHDVGRTGAALAHKLTQATGGLGGAISASPRRLRKLGANHEAIAALALVRRAVKLTLREDMDRRLRFSGPESASDYLFAEMGRLPIEQFRVVYLNTTNQVIHDEVHSTGGLFSTEVYTRDVVGRALEVGAASIILAHNHPSGDLTISGADICVTKNIIELCAGFNIRVLDHIIVGTTGATSFRSEGVMDKYGNVKEGNELQAVLNK